ncbi:MAG: helix-turn-helix transcriptional regulator [Inquilinus sp.]|uniref:helix-turn-helix transcriptional regulator n=1 Tax=Inquilinus sp. TaxID=1932117 RepID=UPI003F3FBF72
MPGRRKDGRRSGPLMSDVARLAGVATSTVSRALAIPGRVNEATRQRIAAAAEQLGYIPNAAARSLRAGSPPPSWPPCRDRASSSAPPRSSRPCCRACPPPWRRTAST